MTLKVYKPKPVHYSAEELEEIKGAFLDFDEDGDGKLNVDEAMNLMDQFAIDPLLAPLVFEICDKDKTGAISYDEFKVYFQLLIDLENDPSCIYRNLFEKFDKDHSGYLDENEAAKFVKFFIGDDSSNREIQKYIRKIDKDRSGKLKFSEIVSFLDKIENDYLNYLE